MSERELLHTDRVLVVEGKYDAARLSHLTDAMILLTDGFGIYKDKIRQQLLKALAKKIGLDPAVMASPFITTIVDALSLLIYFAFSKSLLGV